MDTCAVQGKPHLYGLGIRMSFYIQWFGSIVTGYLNLDDFTNLANVRIIGLLLSAAAFLSLAIQLSFDNLQPADVCIVLLLAMGFYFPLVPLYVWKASSCCNDYWDPFRWSRARERATRSPVFAWLRFALLLCLSGLGVWFWTSFVPGHECSTRQSAFFFSSVQLGHRAYVAFNAILYLLIILTSVGILLSRLGWEIRVWRPRRRRRKIRRAHIALVQDLKTLCTASVAAVVTAAVELTISWNDISGVDQITDTAQAIPLFLAAGFIVRAIFLHFAHNHSSSDSSDWSSARGDSRSPLPTATTRAGPWMPPPPPPVHPA